MPDERTRHKTIGDWAVIVLAAVLAIIGVVLLAGGIWLIALGGSWYYAIAGIGLIASGWFLFKRDMAGVWIYLATFLFTLVWALWERGFNGWAQVPRLVAPTVMLILVLLTLPVVRRHGRRVGHGAAAAAAVGIACLAATGGVGYMTMEPGMVVAQEDAAAPADTQTSPPPLLNSSPADSPAVVTPEQQQNLDSRTGTDLSTNQTPPATSGTAAGEALTPAPTDEAAAAGQGTEDAAASGPQMLAAAQPEATLQVGEDWPYYAGDALAQRYSPLDQITTANVADLEEAWTYHTGDLPSEQAKGTYSPEITPLEIGETLYLCTPKNILIAVEARTGEEEWRFDPKVPDAAIPYGATCRGVAYYVDPDAEEGDLCATRIIEGTLDARLIAVDAKLGQPCTDFGLNGEVNLEAGIGDTVPGWYGHVAVPKIVRGIVVVGAQVKDGQAEDAPSGVIRGYDAVTGELAWAWDMCQPDVTGLPPEGQTYTRGTPNMWTAPAGDEELGYIYLPLGNSSVDYYGGNRLACENEFNSSLVALDVTTGKPVWSFQTVHYDVWDYDLGSQPTLVDVPNPDGGAVTPAVVLPSKQGQIFVLDRRSGESLFPIEERPVPTGGVEPDALSDTQPFSAYHNLIMPDLTEADMWGMSPIDQLWCRIQFHQAAYDGPYTPPTVDKPFIQYPGYNGGSDWGSVAVDPERGILVVNYNDMPNFNQLLTREQADARGLTPMTDPSGDHDNPQAGAPYAIDVNAGWRLPTGLMCKQPPYGGIRAIDLATGKTLWDQPIGEARRNGPFGIPSMLPLRIGTPNNGGAVVTKGGLIFIAAATDNLLRAIDIETGEVLWKAVLPGGGQANPLVFEAGGRQFVAIMPDGHHFMETPVSDALVAYALPQN